MLLHSRTALALFCAVWATLGSAQGQASSLPDWSEDTGRPEVGSLLIATRRIDDPHFRESVVLVLRYGKAGTLGIVLNRPLHLRPADVLTDVKGLDRHEGPLYKGGPVATDSFTLLARGRKGPEGTRPIIDGVHHGSDRPTLERLAGDAKTRQRFRLYVGHAGWAVGQLEWEIEQGSWFVLPGVVAAVFTDEPEELWDNMAPPPEREWVRVLPVATSDLHRRSRRQHHHRLAVPARVPRRP